jgi:hypothetical protein
MNNLESLIIGIVSGIITTALIYLAVLIFRKIVIPWYQEIVYKGIDVGGKWRMSSAEIEGMDMFLNLAQHAHRLKGTLTLFRKNEMESQIDPIRTYKIEGSISNRFIVATLSLIEKNRLGIGTLLFEVVGDGQRLKGNWTYYSVSDSNIDSVECEAERLNGGSSVALQ